MSREEVERRALLDLEIQPTPDFRVVSETANVHWWQGVLYALEYAGEEYDGRVFDSDLWHDLREAIGVV